jgi:hypothetical protein
MAPLTWRKAWISDLSPIFGSLEERRRSNILRTAVSPGWDPQYLTPHWPSTASISDLSPFLTEKPREALEVCFELFQLLKR